MITVAVTVNDADHQPVRDDDGFELPEFPGLVEWAGMADDGEGTCYATIADELADRIVAEDLLSHAGFVSPKLGVWTRMHGDWWLAMHTGSVATGNLQVWHIGICAADINEEMAR